MAGTKNPKFNDIDYRTGMSIMERDSRASFFSPETQKKIDNAHKNNSSLSSTTSDPAFFAPKRQKESGIIALIAKSMAIV